MSNVIPAFNVGEIVRVMDTDWARKIVLEQHWDLANQVGDIRKVRESSAYVALDHGLFEIPLSSLQKYTPPGVIVGRLRVAMTRIAKENGINLNDTTGERGDMFLYDAMTELWQILNS